MRHCRTCLETTEDCVCGDDNQPEPEQDGCDDGGVDADYR